MALSTGPWPPSDRSDWTSRVQRTEDGQIIHTHNGHQYWKDDRWDGRQRPGFNFYTFFFFYPARNRIAFHESHLSAMEPKKRSFLASQKAKGGCSSDANDKMNQAWGNNDCDINNDNVWWALAGKHKSALHAVSIPPDNGRIYLFIYSF